MKTHKMLEGGLKDTNMTLKTTVNMTSGQTITAFNHQKTQKFPNYLVQSIGFRSGRYHQSRIKAFAGLVGLSQPLQLLSLQLRSNKMTLSSL